MVVANVRGRTPTKRIDMYKDHEFVIGRLVLGGDESAEAPTVILGAGTWAAPIECTEADHHFINLITRGMATSAGSSKVIAVDHYVGVSGASPTIFRGCMELEDGISAANASAADFTLRFGTAGSKVVGEGHALAAQLRWPNRVSDAGTYSCAKFEAYLDGTSADPTGSNNPSIVRFQVVGGNAAAQRKMPSLFYIVGPEGNMAAKYIISNADPTTAGVAKGLQININGTQYWLAAYTIA